MLEKNRIKGTTEKLQIEISYHYAHMLNIDNNFILPSAQTSTVGAKPLSDRAPTELSL